MGSEAGRASSSMPKVAFVLARVALEAHGIRLDAGPRLEALAEAAEEAAGAANDRPDYRCALGRRLYSGRKKHELGLLQFAKFLPDIEIVVQHGNYLLREGVPSDSAGTNRSNVFPN